MSSAYDQYIEQVGLDAYDGRQRFLDSYQEYLKRKRDLEESADLMDDDSADTN